MQDAPRPARARRPLRRAGDRAGRAACCARSRRRPPGLALGELATAVALPKSTVHRLVQALADEDLVRTGAGGRIRLGPGLARLGAAAHDALADTLRLPLQDLRRALDETADLAVLDGATVRFIDQAPAPHRLRAVSAVGSAFPLHCTANGKALLSGLADDAVRDLLPAQLHAVHRRRRSPTRAALLAELDERPAHRRRVRPRGAHRRDLRRRRARPRRARAGRGDLRARPDAALRRQRGALCRRGPRGGGRASG